MNGMTAGEALRLVIELTRNDAEAPAGVSRVVTAAELAVKLRAANVDARHVRIETPDDLAAIGLPAAAQLGDGTWVVLRERGRVVTTDGTCRLSRATVFDAGVRNVVERMPDIVVQPRLTRFLLSAARGHGRALAMLVAAAFLVRTAMVLVPELTGFVVDRALPNGARSMVMAIAMAIVLAATMQALLHRFRGRLLTFIRAAVDTSTGRGFMRHLMHQPFSAVDSVPRGEMLQSAYGIQLARDTAFDQLVPAALDLAPLLVVGALLFAKSPSLAVVAVLAGVLIASVHVAAAMRQAALQRGELALQARHRSLFLEALSGITSVKAAGAEAQISARWTALQRREVALSLQRRRVASVAEVVSDALRQGAIAIILVWGGLAAMRGSLSLGTLVVLVQLCTMFIGSTLSLAAAAAAVLQLRPQLARSNEFLRSPRIASGGSAIHGAVRVELEDVWFRYGASSPWVLSGKSLVVEPGEKLRLAAASGGGKTTLLRLVAGVHEPARGSIRINGIDANRADGVAYLPQFPYLFGGTVLENLRIFSGDAPLERVLRMAVETGLDEWVRSMPMAYDTILASGGSNISGGQRQLITLTAVLASDRPLLLLDEPMANLDRDSAARIWRIAAQERKTIIYAEHDAAASRQSAA
jgi:ABC-type bacteriocin/lantibiotic exporter with double-glycine peptidase domain